MFDWLSLALELLNLSSHLIIWNLFLAFIPLLCSWFLFRPSVTPSLIWWTVFWIFLAFLPNAPYILTDTIHLLELSHLNYHLSLIIFVLIPQYTLFVLAGFEAYAIALMALDDYLIQQGKEKYVFLVDLIIHALCAVGIYLGRFERFNSWDLLTQPLVIFQSISNHLGYKWHIFSVLVTFMLLIPLYWLSKTVNRQIIARLSFIKN